MLPLANLEFSNAAEADLEAIDQYSVSQFGEAVAATYMLGFKDAFALMMRHPLIGEEKPDLGRSLRCLVHRQHRIFYRVHDDLVVIIRVIHHAQDARRALN